LKFLRTGPTNQDVIIKVELDPEVDPKGKYEIEYSKDGGETWEKYDPETGIIVEENGEVEIRLTDGEEHGEGVKVEINNIDKNPPTLEVTAKNTSKTITVNTVAKDEESGIKEYIYQIGEKNENGEITWREPLISKDPSYKFENLKKETDYEIKVTVKDEAGNETTKQISKSTNGIPDLITSKNEETGEEPNVKIEVSESGPTNQDVIVKIELDESVDPEGKYEIEYSKDGGENWEKYDPETGIVVEENGEVDIRLTEGEEQGESITIEINNIDKVPPTASIEVEPKSTRIEVEVTAQDEGSGIKEYIYYLGKIDENGNTTWEEPIVTNEPNYTFENLTSQTEYKIKVEVKDEAGNVTTVETRTATTDGIDSSKYIKMTPNTKKWTTENVIVTIKEQSENYKAEYSLDGKTWEEFEGTKKVEVEENGTIFARVKDEVEEGDSVSLTIGNIDKQDPEVEITPIEQTSRSIKVALNATEDVSGIAKVIWYYKLATKDNYDKEEYNFVVVGSNMKGKLEFQKEFEYLDLPYGEYWVCAEVMDTAGNVTLTDTEIVNPIEVTPGEDGVQFTANQNWTNQNVNVQVSSKDDRYTAFGSRDQINWLTDSNYEVVENGSVYAKLTDGINCGKVTSYQVENIDKQNPEASIEVTEVTSKAFKIDLSATDNLSGIGKITWYYKNQVDEGWKTQIQDIRPIQGAEAGNLEEHKQLHIDNQIRGTYQVYAVVTDVAGNEIRTNEETLELEEITRGENALTFTPDNTNWTNQDVVVTVTNSDNRYTIQTSIDGINWEDKETATLPQNGEAMARLTDGVNYGEIAKIPVNNIDKSPAEVTLNNKEVTSKTITMEATITDTLSGLGKIDWYYKKQGETQYHKDTQEYQEIKGANAGELSTTKEITYQDLTSGTYQMYAEITDVAGNVTTTPVKEVTLLTITPGVNGIRITASNENWTNENVEMTATSTDERYTVQTSKDGNTWEDKNQVTYEANGTIYARLTDGINVGQPTTRAITNIDKQKAKLTVGNAQITSRAYTQTVTVTDNLSGLGKIEIYYRKKGETTYKVKETVYQAIKGSIAGETTTSKNIVIDGLTSGTYETYTVVTDVAGNVTNELTDGGGEGGDNPGGENPGGEQKPPQEITLETITSGETALSLSPSTTNWTNQPVNITVQNTDNRYTIQTKKDGEDWKNTNQVSVSKNGNVLARLTDGINGGEAKSITINNIDTTKATAQISNTSKTTKAMSIKVAAQDSESGIAQITWYYQKVGESQVQSKTQSYATINGGTKGAATKEDTKTFENLRSGSYTVYAVVTDVAGNQTATGQITVTLNTVTSAVGQISLAPSTTQFTNGNVTVTATTTNTQFSIQTSEDGTNWTSATQRTLTQNKTVYARLYDGVNGGESTSLVVGNIDKLPPNTFTPTATSTTNSITLTGTATDAAKTTANASSGISKYYFSKNNGSTWEPANGQAGNSYTFTGLAQGTYTLKMKAVDKAGNTKESNSISVTLHVHTDSCYAHKHTDSCYSTHYHTGSSSYGTGCYGSPHWTTGTVTCSNCSGSGKTTCSSCKGVGGKTCTGKLSLTFIRSYIGENGETNYEYSSVCSKCGKTGIYTSGYPDPTNAICLISDCTECNATGKTTCSTCSGSGTVSSSYIDYYNTDCGYYDGERYLSCGKSENLTLICGY